jgi:hypothetical protein
MQGPILTSVVSPRYPRQVSRPLAPQSQPKAPLCISLNVLQKRKRQRDNLAYPNALHNESGDSLPRRPRKRHKLFLELSAPSAESLSDIAITEEYDSAAVTKRNYDAKSTYVGASICCANIPPGDCAPSAPHYPTPPVKAMSKFKFQGSSLRCSSGNDQRHEKADNPNCAYECAPEDTLTTNGTRPVARLKDSPPVPAIDFTRLQFPSRNRSRFPLLCSEPVTSTVKVGSREDAERSAKPTASNHTPNQFAQDVPSATQQSAKSAVLESYSSGDHKDTETALPVTRRDTRVGSSGSPGRLGEVIDSRHDTLTYHMDNLIRARNRTTGRDDVRSATLWENNAMWKGMRFWHENLKKPTWKANM